MARISWATRDTQCAPQWDATPKGDANPLKARPVQIEGCKDVSGNVYIKKTNVKIMRVELHPHNSVYVKALKSKRVASFILLPLIEFEFAFHGSEKPVLTQSEPNYPQLEVLFEICKKHGWLSSKKISPLGNKKEFCFKLSNRGFAEIYCLAGPMADSRKDEWAKLLCERAENSEKSRKIKNQIFDFLKKSDRSLSTLEICLETRRLPYTVTRHLRKFEKAKIVQKTEDGWKLLKSANIPANSPS